MTTNRGGIQVYVADLRIPNDVYNANELSTIKFPVRAISFVGVRRQAHEWPEILSGCVAACSQWVEKNPMLSKRQLLFFGVNTCDFYSHSILAYKKFWKSTTGLMQFDPSHFRQCVEGEMCHDGVGYCYATVSEVTWPDIHIIGDWIRRTSRGCILLPAERCQLTASILVKFYDQLFCHSSNKIEVVRAIKSRCRYGDAFLRFSGGFDDLDCSVDLIGNIECE